MPQRQIGWQICINSKLAIFMQTTQKKKKRSFNSRHPRFKAIAYFMLGAGIVIAVLLPLPLFLLPKKYLYPLGRKIGYLFVFPAIRKKVHTNLFYVYGEKMTKKRADAITKKIAANNVFFILDCYYLWIFHFGFNINKTVVNSINKTFPVEALKSKKGVIGATAHYGCFEIIPVYFLDAGLVDVGGVIARNFPSPFLTWLNRKARLIAGIPSFYDQAKDIFKALKSNGVIGFLPDLRAKRRLGVESTFFGKPTLTLPVHVRLASQLGSEIIPVFLNRHKRCAWEFTIIFYPAIAVPRKADANVIKQKVQEVNDALEYHIRRYPSGWFWFNNKWKLW